MKLSRKKLAAFALTVAYAVISTASAAPVYAEENGAVSKNQGDFAFNSVLEEYFCKRENDFDGTNAISAQGINLIEQSEEIAAEEMRPMLISKMEEKLNIMVVSAETSYSVSQSRTEGNTVYLDVYEWTNVDYTGESGLIDTMGYGVDHEMVLEKDGTGYSIASDVYDEGPLTCMSSSLSTEEFAELMSTDYSVSAIAEDEYENTEAGSVERTVSGYNPYKAAEYANNYVNPNAHNSDDDTSFYNLNEFFYNEGADCTNYVSQCLYAGGVPMRNIGNSNTGWWYDRHSAAVFSGSWITAPYNFNYFSASHTSYSNISNSSYVIPGNPVYYDWQNSTDGDNDIDHAAICVGYNSSGVPIVNSHTNDYYHAPWDYGYPNTRHYTVKITNDDVLNTPSVAAVLKYDEVYYAKLDNTTDVDCFAFKATANKTYTFLTTGNTNTYGKLCSSNGTVLATDDNSSNLNNFSLSYNLVSGKTYYIYVSSPTHEQGFYGLEVF